MVLELELEPELELEAEVGVEVEAEAEVATSPLPSWGSPTLSMGRGQKSEMASSPTCGQSGYITPAISGVPKV